MININWIKQNVCHWGDGGGVQSARGWRWKVHVCHGRGAREQLTTNRGCTQEGMSRIYFWDPWWRASVEHRALLWSGRATLKLGTPQTRIFAVQVSSEGCCCSLVQYFIQQLLLGLVCLQPAPSSIAGILYRIQKPPVALFFSSHLQITLCYNNTLYLQLLLLVFKWHTAVFCV